MAEKRGWFAKFRKGRKNSDEHENGRNPISSGKGNAEVLRKFHRFPHRTVNTEEGTQAHLGETGRVWTDLFQAFDMAQSAEATQKPLRMKKDADVTKGKQASNKNKKASGKNGKVKQSIKCQSKHVKKESAHKREEEKAFVKEKSDRNGNRKNIPRPNIANISQTKNKHEPPAVNNVSRLHHRELEQFVPLTLTESSKSTKIHGCSSEAKSAWEAPLFQSSRSSEQKIRAPAEDLNRKRTEEALKERNQRGKTVHQAENAMNIELKTHCMLKPHGARQTTTTDAPNGEHFYIRRKSSEKTTWFLKDQESTNIWDKKLPEARKTNRLRSEEDDSFLSFLCEELEEEIALTKEFGNSSNTASLATQVSSLVSYNDDYY